MKIPITDQFLWDMYRFLNGVSDVGHIIFRNPGSMRNVVEENPLVKAYRKQKNRHQFTRLIYWLKKNNYIKVKNLQGKSAIILTKKGVHKALKASFKIENYSKKEKRKDGKWIMVIFDIPKKNENKRGILRSVLQNLGYKMFQKSVWISPYDVFERTEKLLQFYSLDVFVRILLVEEII